MIKVYYVLGVMQPLTIHAVSLIKRTLFVHMVEQGRSQEVSINKSITNLVFHKGSLYYRLEIGTYGSTVLINVYMSQVIHIPLPTSKFY